MSGEGRKQTVQRVCYFVTKQKPRRSTIQASGRPTWGHQMTETDKDDCINRDRHRSSEHRASRVEADPKEGLMRHLQIDYLPTYILISLSKMSSVPSADVMVVTVAVVGLVCVYVYVCVRMLVCVCMLHDRW